MVVLYGAIAIGTATSSWQWTPKLALDLEGGNEITLTPQPAAAGQAAQKPTPDQLKEAVNVIRQRVNGSGVSEAEVSTQGGQNIVVDLPGTPDAKTKELVKQSAQLSFRPVLVEDGAVPTPTATPTPTVSGTATPSASSSAKASAKATTSTSSTQKAANPSATNGRILPQALTKHAVKDAAVKSLPKAAATTPTTAPTSAAATGSSATSGSTTTTPSAASSPTATDPTAALSAGTPSDLNQITNAVGTEFTSETCQNLNTLQLEQPSRTKPFVTCSTDGTTKYILGPVELDGTDIKSASAQLGTTSQGLSNGQWQVLLNFKSSGAKKFANVTGRLVNLTQPQNEFAVVLDGLVISAPATQARIGDGTAQITGSFTQSSATALAQQLKFGALPVSFKVQTDEQISATLGSQQLQHGLLAGVIGLILVVGYSLLQYRALGLVTIFSLTIAGGFTYGLVSLLGSSENFRLSLAGVAGLIVSIGITADSFIVYFERVRDEVREGRPLRSAVEAGWGRARRTILASDTVNFLAAVVLYFLAIGSVRGFAFTLGLTTLVDIVVVFLFTKPAVTALSRTEFFGGGHRFSGFSSRQLGKVPTYVGRGRTRPPTGAASGQSIAARRAAELAAEQDGDDDPGGSDGPRGSGDARTDRVSAGRTNNPRRDV
jgi:preprotein translocase subunit SecD